jgi:hypothetical protein
MLHFYDRATMAHALTLDLEPRLHALLSDRISKLTEDLLDYTEFLIVEADDTEEDVVRVIGFSPLLEPIDGTRFGEPGFQPGWDWLQEHDGWFEMIVTFGGTFAYVLLIDAANASFAALLERHSNHV